ncbi:MAG: SNF2-related protein, partial [Bacteroidota bacterium]
MASTYGKTWWGQQWLNSLNNIDYSNRLPRGASYARKGAVKKIKIVGNRITAKVIGSRSAPYNVGIIIPPFFDPELANFLKDIQHRPVIISKLLNRELDPSILQLAEKSGLKVFPHQWSDLKMQCSCPDWAVPCKHLASVIYKVSAEIDNNPFLVFELHNVDLLGELAKAGVFINNMSIDVPSVKNMLFAKATKDNAYDTELAYQKLNFSGLDPLHESLTALLSPMPAFYTLSATDFRDKYLTTLKRVVRNTQRAASGKKSLSEFFQSTYSDDNNIGHRSTNTVALDEALQVRVITDEKECSVPEFLQQLSHIPGARTPDFQPSTAALHTAIHLALQLTANGAIIPQIVQLPNKKYSIRWLPALLSEKVAKLCDELEQILPPDVFTGVYRNKIKSVNKDRAVNLLSLLITEMVHLASFKVDNDLFLELFFKNSSYAFTDPGEESLAGGIMAWLQKFYLSRGETKPALVVEESGNNRFKVNIDVQIPEGTFKHTVSLKNVLTQNEFENRRYEILQTLALMSGFIDGLDDYINSFGEKDIIMDSERFAPFLMKIVPAIQLLDIPVLLPKSLQSILKPKPSVKLKSKGKSSGFLRLDKLLDFEWQVAVGDTLLSEAQFKQLLQQSEGLIRFKTNYIYVEKEELEKLYKHFTSPKQLTAFQLMRAALSGEYQGAAIAFDTEVEQLIQELNSVSEVPLPEDLNAQLRPYQHRGFSWIYRNARIGFGSVLADDMGLGKTIQVIAAILKFKEERYLDTEKVMVVAPTGLLTNWLAEIQKFAPSLRAEIYHGTHRCLEKLDNYDVLITSYGIIRSDADMLKKKKWYVLIID